MKEIELQGMGPSKFEMIWTMEFKIKPWKLYHTLGDARALQGDEIDLRNRSNMKYIERSGQKTNIQLWGLETDELVEGMKERDPMEEEAPHEPSKPLVARVEERSPKIMGHWDLERESELEKATVGGLNTPRSAPDWTLSRLARLCLAQPDFVQ
jgi:hypothetical protein